VHRIDHPADVGHLRVDVLDDAGLAEFLDGRRQLSGELTELRRKDVTEPNELGLNQLSGFQWFTGLAVGHLE